MKRLINNRYKTPSNKYGGLIEELCSQKSYLEYLIMESLNETPTEERYKEIINSKCDKCNGYNKSCPSYSPIPGAWGRIKTATGSLA